MLTGKKPALLLPRGQGAALSPSVPRRSHMAGFRSGRAGLASGHLGGTGHPRSSLSQASGGLPGSYHTLVFVVVTLIPRQALLLGVLTCDGSRPTSQTWAPGPGRL